MLAVSLAAFPTGGSAHSQVAATVAVCKSWASAASGSWNVGGNWSPAGVPTSTDDVCIDLDGTYTVTLDVVGAAKSLTVGGSTGTQTLVQQATCSAHANLTVSEDSSLNSHAALELSSTGCANQAILELGSNTLTNGGSITASVGAGGLRALRGNLTNNGTVALNQDLSYDRNPSTWLNQGPLTIATAKTLTLPNSQTFTNATGGSITQTGTGKLTLTNGTYNHGAGTFTGTTPIDSSTATSTSPGRPAPATCGTARAAT